MLVLNTNVFWLQMWGEKAKETARLWVHYIIILQISLWVILNENEYVQNYPYTLAFLLEFSWPFSLMLAIIDTGRKSQL